MHLVYDVRRDDAPLRHVAGILGEFDLLRKHLSERGGHRSVCNAIMPQCRIIVKIRFSTQLL